MFKKIEILLRKYKKKNRLMWVLMIAPLIIIQPVHRSMEQSCLSALVHGWSQVNLYFSCQTEDIYVLIWIFLHHFFVFITAAGLLACEHRLMKCNDDQLQIIILSICHKNLAEPCPGVEKLWIEGDDELARSRILLVSVITIVLYLASSYTPVVINDV